MTYRELLARLFAARRFGVVLGIERMRELLDALGAPDHRLGTVIHVGGTNGKGSTIAMIAAIARAAGLRVATYTSPHLTTVRERIAIDGAAIREEAFVAAAARVRAAGGDELTFFEQLTAIACVAIADANVDVTILEVGLGGRLDATNAIAAAPIAVVTGVAMDHEAILGERLQAIANEKAGIFKPGQLVVIGASGEDAGAAMLEPLARARGVAAITRIDARAPRVPTVALPGAHQRRNAAAALAAIDHLETVRGIRIDDATRARALATVVHPGRFELVAGTPPLILDGAHNPHGAAALAAALQERGERPVLILAVSADKDVHGIVRALAPAVAAIIATRYQQERALEPTALAARAREVTALPVEVAPDLATADALARAHGRSIERALARPLDRTASRPSVSIVIAGSLFLVGEARARYLGAEVDPIVLSDPAATPQPR